MPSSADCATLQAIMEGVEAARIEAELEWGADRLLRLAGDDLRMKLRRQQERFSQAYQQAWESDFLSRDHLEAVQAAAGGMRRAWPALVAAAVEAGHRPLHPDVWEVRLADGTIAALVRTNDEAAKVIADGRQLVVYTMAEIANLIDVLVPQSLQLAKVHFPGARFEPSGRPPVDRSWVKDGDQIPFGEKAA